MSKTYKWAAGNEPLQSLAWALERNAKDLKEIAEHEDNAAAQAMIYKHVDYMKAMGDALKELHADGWKAPEDAADGLNESDRAVIVLALDAYELKLKKPRSAEIVRDVKVRIMNAG